MSPDTLQTAFLIVNAAVMPAWVLLAVAPRGVLADSLVHSALYPIVLGLLYAGLMGYAFASGAVPADADFTTLQGLSKLLMSPLAALIGWVHYLVFDLFVGAWIARDCVRRGVSAVVRVVALFFTLMTGPIGLMLYLILRRATGKGGMQLVESQS